MAEAPADVVHAFLDALEALDFDAAGHYLAADDFRYTGPTITAHSGAGFMAEIARLESILKRIDRHRTLSDGNHASLLVTLHTHVPDLASTRIALWATVRDRRIARMEFIYDASVYTGLFQSMGC